ncbi:multisubunit sodium/proton antiporter MrpD subunit [Salinibacterium amurskyense]|uniref:Multisubunit sodium/proton antiporter MrpD subunit n=1 Tax=Salinibacterium amurskyense TaxID=205941 RepID=A0A2M9D7F1_9MICO|nr:Na+/H+ antiporter subunit D [Salinibacterium amurskyense]PJJ81635.1 multisubunit sodium/proton antiporter MrpD subunit [Salinibacterium amurskyense]RLQ83619.1 Na+/H+ antiporter subunit D [Salinibacterium amurskyense]GHD79824.1 putative cation antiporter NADH dehydrogenase subunit [Salinibacterium amurskyense]
MSALTTLVVLLPLLGAAAALTQAKRPRVQTLITVGVLTAVLAIGAALLVAVDTNGAIAVEVGGWPAPYGIVLVVDRLSALMIVVSAAVLLAVLVFSVGQGLADGDRETPVSIYYPTYLILATGVFNAFVAGDLFNLYVSFEILLVASYVLITLGGTEPRIRAGTVYIVVSLVSSAIFLAAIAMIYGATGTVNIAQLTVRLAELPADVQLTLHVMLLIGFGIKAAVFPLSFWLPDSYPMAPAPVTAVFAGLLTKVGVYAIIRTEMIIFPDGELNTVLLIVAALTMVVGILGAVAQSDIKRLLSFTLISHIGYMLFGIGIDTAAGLAAATYYIVHHITVQTTLFLATGLVERQGGTTGINKLGGMLKASPLIAVLFFIPLLNLGGIPPFSGFLGKLALFEAGANNGSTLAWVLIGCGAAVSLLTLYALARAWSMIFWRDAEEVADYENPLAMSSENSSSATVESVRTTPRIMVGATVAMVAVSVALTVFATPLFDLSANAGENIDGPAYYVNTVFPGGLE